jgi:hypothetical protein
MQTGAAAEIVFDHVTKRYPGRDEPAVEDLSLTIPAGEICVLSAPPAQARKENIGSSELIDTALTSGKINFYPEYTGVVAGCQDVAPVVSKKLVSALGPRFTATVNAVSSKLTNAAMIAMNKAVDVDKKKPAAVAAAFLKANGLA